MKGTIKTSKKQTKMAQNGSKWAMDGHGSRAHRGGPRGPRDPPMVAPHKKSKVQSIHEEQRLSGASGAKTYVSEQKPAKNAYQMPFLRSSKMPEGTMQEAAKTP